MPVDIFAPIGFGPRTAVRAVPEEFDDSELDELAGGNRLMSLLQYVGETLDKPGRAVRGLLAGRPEELANLIPFSDMMGLTDPAQSVSGRDLLETHGILDANEEGLDLGDVAGFGAEVLTDPFTFFSLGTSAAATKAGKIAKKLNKFPKRSLINAKTGLMEAGKRAMRREAGGFEKHVLSGLDDVTRPLAEDLAEKAGTTLDALASEPLSRGAKLGIPFTGIETTFDLPFGLSDRMAGGLDKLGHALRVSRPGVKAVEYFGRDTMGAPDLPSQLGVQRAYEAAEQAKGVADQEFFGHRNTLFKHRLLNEANRDTLTNILEGTAPGLRQPMTTAESVAMHLPALDDLGRTEVTHAVDSLKAQLERTRLGKEATGAESRGLLDSVTDYAPREVTDPDVFSGTAGANRLFNTTDKGARSEWTKAVPGGRAVIDQAMQDPRLHKAWKDALIDPTTPDLLIPPTTEGPFTISLQELDEIAPIGVPNKVSTIPGKYVDDVTDLTAEQAGKMQEQPDPFVSRTVLPKAPKRALTQGTELAAREYFGWTDETFQELAAARETAEGLKDAQDILASAKTAGDAPGVAMGEEMVATAQQAAKRAEALTDELTHSKNLLVANGQRRDEFMGVIGKDGRIEGGRRFYGNDPLLDLQDRLHRDIDTTNYAKQLIDVAGAGAQVFPTADMIPAGMVSARSALGEMKLLNNPVAQSNAIKSFAESLKKYGVIDDATFDRLAGPHAVYTSGLKDAEFIRNARKQAKELGLDDDAVAALEADALESGAIKNATDDGLLMLDRIGVPASLVEHSSRVNKWFAGNPGSPVGQQIREWTTWLKGHLTQAFPSFANRNLLSLGWMFNVVGAGKLGWVKQWKDMDAILKGRDLDDAWKMPIFAGRKFSAKNNQEANALLRGMLSQHGVAEPMREAAEVADDLLPKREMQNLGEKIVGEKPIENPGIMGMNYWRQWFTGMREKGGLNPFGKNFAPTKAGAKVNSYYEALGRGATMLGLLRQGYAPDAATAVVRSAHVDYRMLSPFERQYVKNVIPFYTYASRAVPWTFRNLMEHPGGLTAQAIRAERQPESKGGFLPPQVQGSIAAKLGGEVNGVQRFLTGIDLPFETVGDVAKIGGSITETASETLRSLLGQSHPWITGPFEQAVGVNLYQGRNLRDLDPMIGRLGAQLTMQGEPLVGPSVFDTILAKSPFSRYATTLRQITDPRKDVLSKATNFATGARITDVDMDRSRELEAVKAIKEQARNRGARVFEDVRFTRDQLEKLSPEDREQAEKLQKMLSAFAKRGRERAKEKAAK